MRRIVRTVAAGIVIILGLALVSAAAFSSDVVTGRLPEAPSTGSKVEAVAPLDPNAGAGPRRKAAPAAPDVFATEFGKRGKHSVTATVSGGGAYQVSWRGGDVEQGAGAFSRTRTVKGGFPLVLVIVNSLGRSASCSVTIDGVEKDTQSATAKTPIFFCSA